MSKPAAHLGMDAEGPELTGVDPEGFDHRVGVGLGVHVRATEAGKPPWHDGVGGLGGAGVKVGAEDRPRVGGVNRRVDRVHVDGLNGVGGLGPDLRDVLLLDLDVAPGAEPGQVTADVGLERIGRGLCWWT